MSYKSPKIEGVEVLSPSAIVLDEDMPLAGPITVSIAALAPLPLQSKCCIAVKGSKGRYHYGGGFYAGGRVYYKTRKADNLTLGTSLHRIVADKVAGAGIGKGEAIHSILETLHSIHPLLDAVDTETARCIAALTVATLEQEISVTTHTHTTLYGILIATDLLKVKAALCRLNGNTLKGIDLDIVES